MDKIEVTILILIDGFLQLDTVFNCPLSSKVTILILIDGFLQSNKRAFREHYDESQSLF